MVLAAAGGRREQRLLLRLPQTNTLQLMPCASSMGTLVRVELAKWQRNDVFEAVQKAGLSPDEFEWEAGGPNESTLHHLQSGAWFLFGGNAGGYATRYSAGDGPIDERKSASWFGVTRQVELWLSAVRRDIETPDMWVQL